GQSRNDASRQKLYSQTSKENEILSLTGNKDQQDFDVSFFPEGGNLSEGVVCRVAFKALNQDGTAASVTGKLIDEQGVEISAAETFYAGMGAFSYIPEAGKRYYFRCRNANGVEKRFELPQPQSDGCLLNAFMRGDKWVISLQKSTSAADRQLYILAHCRGTVLYFAEWNAQQGGITFQKDQLPAGIIQFLLFDSQMNPLSERLIFSKNKISEKVEFQTDKTVYEKREKIIATIKPPSNGVDEEDPSPSASERVGVRCSISITDDRDIPVDESVTILSSLLLSSELKGYIENPAYYLLDTKESETALELLMMTHGWRRYNVPEVVRGRIETPQIPFQTAQEISGHVKALLSKRSIPDSEISIFTPGAFWQTKADSVGVFSFQDVEFPDSTTFYIQALNRKGSDNVELVMNKDSFPLPVYAPQSPFSNPPTAKIVTTESPSENDFFIQKASQRANYDDDMRLINLAEIEVTARKIDIQKDEPRKQFWANISSDQTIRRDKIERVHFRSIAEYVAAFGTGVRLTTVTTASGRMYYVITMNMAPTGAAASLFVDGVQRSWDESIFPEEIESIDIFRTASVLTFGGSGANGVVSLTTRRGGDRKINIEKYNYSVFNPLGYQKPVEFYSPKYETWEAKQSTTPDLRTTIFWKPDVVISEETGDASFEFYASDFPTTYSVVIEGITADGRIVRQVEKMRVE
ncbi:MAG: hypothetical protein LBE56_04590, partial [Tannerella sp.]|nr:hypothetical protein [Tannerella sp.]